MKIKSLIQKLFGTTSKVKTTPDTTTVKSEAKPSTVTFEEIQEIVKNIDVQKNKKIIQKRLKEISETKKVK